MGQRDQADSILLAEVCKTEGPAPKLGAGLPIVSRPGSRSRRLALPHPEPFVDHGMAWGETTLKCIEPPRSLNTGVAMTGVTVYVTSTP